MATKNDFSQLPDPREKLGYLFWQINMLWVRKINQKLNENGLSHTQMITLAATNWLTEHNQNVIQQDLVDAIKLDRMMISKMVSKLEKAGFLKKSPSKDDSRVNIIRVTKKGKDLLYRSIPILIESEEEFYGLLGDDKEEITKKLQTLLEKVEEHMNVKNKITK